MLVQAFRTVQHIIESTEWNLPAKNLTHIFPTLFPAVPDRPDRWPI